MIIIIFIIILILIRISPIAFRMLEPRAFLLCPRVPAIYLPWKLSANFYFPSHITLVLFSVLNSCLISPIIEETCKLLCLKWFLRNDQTRIRKNNGISKISKMNDKKNEIKLENKTDNNFDDDTVTTNNNNGNSRDDDSNSENNKITNIITEMKAENIPGQNILKENRQEHSLRSYMTIMTAISIGIKVADNVRRILLYTHSNQKHKMFFSIARSFFPGT